MKTLFVFIVYVLAVGYEAELVSEVEPHPQSISYTP